jgi:superfamily I DNA/RNA helicase
MVKFYPSMEEIKRLLVQPTDGEWRLLKFLEENLKDESFEIYYHPEMSQLEVDLLIMRRGHGILLIEVVDDNIKDCKEINEYKNIQDILDEKRKGLKYRFKPAKNSVMLSSIHSYKGWDISTEFLIIDNEEYYDNPNCWFPPIEAIDEEVFDFNTGKVIPSSSKSKKLLSSDEIEKLIDDEDAVFRDSSKDVDDDFDEGTPRNINELIYTAITRARQNLIIINLGNQRYDSFFRQAKSVKVRNIEDLKA